MLTIPHPFGFQRKKKNHDNKNCTECSISYFIIIIYLNQSLIKEYKNKIGKKMLIIYQKKFWNKNIYVTSNERISNST